MPDVPTPAPPVAALRYDVLTQRNPEYRASEWALHRALYEGGNALLGNRPLLSQVIPQNPYEGPETYALRLRMAEYINYVGEIIDFIVASLGADPLTMSAAPPASPFFETFQRATDGHQMTLASLMRRQILTALVCKRAWTLLDLPPTNEGAVIESAADEEQFDALRALAFPIEPESVIDWCESPSGALEWAIVKMVSVERPGLTGSRNTTVERYTYLTKTTWARYDVTYPTTRGAPTAGTIVKLADSGTHTFGAVPLVPLELSDGMYALAKLANLALSHLRKRSGLSWMEFCAFYPQLVAYLGPETPTGGEIPSAAQQDPGRLTSQTFGNLRPVAFGDKDKLEYLSPGTDIITAAMADLAGLRDEMHRIMSHMALAADNSAAALGRGGDSKSQDKASAAVILSEIGRLGREHAVAVCSLASAGRKDPPTVWTAHGMEEFEGTDAVLVANEAEVVQGLTIPSQTFHELYGFRVAKALLQGAATPDDLATVKKEIKAALDEAAKAAKLAAKAAAEAAANPPTGDSDDSPNNSPSDAPGADEGGGDTPSIPPPGKLPTDLTAPDGHIVVPAHVRALPGRAGVAP